LKIKFTNCLFCIFGDFNARTGFLSDFVDFDKYVINENFDAITMQHIVMNNLDEFGFPVERFSFDSKCNNYGQRLIQLCKSANIFIGNGRCGNDA
jgi:hypothetical protein